MVSYNQLIDNLQKADTPNEKLQCLLRLVYYTTDCNHQLWQEYAQQALSLAHQLHDYAAVAMLYADQLTIATLQGKSEDMYQILSKLFSTLPLIKGQTLYYYLMGYLLSFLASAFENHDYHIKAIHYNYLCLKDIEQIAAAEYKNHFYFDIKTRTLSNLAYSFIVLKRYDEAETHLQLAEYFITDLSLLNDRVELYHWQCRLYEQQERYDEAIYAANQCLQISKECPFPVLRNSLTYSIKGRVLVKMKKDYKNALFCFEQATSIAKYFDFGLSMGNNYEHQARCYEHLKDYKNSLSFYRLSCQAQRKTSLNYLNQTFRLIKAQLESSLSHHSQLNFHTNDLLAHSIADTPSIKTQTLTIFNFILNNCQQKDISPENIAQAFNISLRTMNRRLTHLFNMTGVQLINHARFKKAYHLLTTTTYSILEIAEMIGIDQLSYFSQSFRKQHGLSPTQLRRQQN